MKAPAPARVTARFGAPVLLALALVAARGARAEAVAPAGDGAPAATVVTSRLGCPLLSAMVGEGGAGRNAGEFETAGSGAAPTTLLALANPYLVTPALEVRLTGGRKNEKPSSPSPGRRSRHRTSVALTPERSQALLRSATLPGWGQATLGHHTAGAVFGVIETGIWGSFAAFRIQEQLRRDASSRTARIFASVDLHGRDEEFRRLVGAFASSSEYNQLVVFRDAANLYYDDPARYRDYIAIHSLGGSNSWSWENEASFLRYRSQRKEAQRAALRSNTALALAVANRILSVLHTTRVAGRHAAGAAAPARSWNFEVRPAGGADPTAFVCGLRARF